MSPSFLWQCCGGIWFILVPFVGHFRIDVGLPVLLGLITLMGGIAMGLYIIFKTIKASFYYRKLSSFFIALLSIGMGPLGGLIWLEASYSKLDEMIRSNVNGVLIGIVSDHDRIHGYRSYLSTQQQLKDNFNKWAKPRHVSDVLSREECQFIEDSLFANADKLIHVDTQVYLVFFCFSIFFLESFFLSI